MSTDKLANALREDKGLVPDRMPELVRKAVDQAYERLAEVDPASIRRRRRNRRGLRRAGAVLVFLLVAGGLLIGSGFVSPAMANSLKQIPWIQSLYERFGDEGLAAATRNGMVRKENYSLTKAGRTVTISDLMYDGARLSVAVQVQADDGKLPNAAVETFSVNARVNGEDGPYSFSIGGTKRIDERTAVRIIDMGHSGFDGRTQQAYDFPDAFELTLSIAIAPRKGIDDGIYDFIVPIEKNAPGAVTLSSDQIIEYEGVTWQVESLEITPATIHLVTLLGIAADTTTETPARFKGNRFLRYALFDENGNELKSLGGGSSIRVGDRDLFKGKQDFVGIGTSAMPKTITVKSYAGWTKGPDGKPENDYIEELEITLELP